MRRDRKRQRKLKQQRNAARSAELDPDAFEMMEDVLSDISIEELREFLEADLFDVPVDPEFKAQLRERLWDLVQSRAPMQRPGGSDPSGWEPESGPH